MPWIQGAILSLLGALACVQAIEIKAPLSQGKLRGEVRFSQQQAGGDVNVRVVLLLTDGAEAKNIDWQIREFPVDYRVVDGGDRCSNGRLGKTLINLGERLGQLNLPENSTVEFVIPGGYLNLTKTDGIWGRSLILRGDTHLACATLMVEGDERIAEAHFRGPLGGSVLFRWFGAEDGVDAVILSKLYRVQDNNTAVRSHNWKIYVTDSVETEADKARDNCNSLQLVFDPDDRGIGSRPGDLDLRLGQVKTGTTHLLRDANLPELHETSSATSARSLYIVVFDWKHGDSILACARVRKMNTKKALAIIQGGGLKAKIKFEQRSPYDLTFITTEDKNRKDEDWDYQVRELPANGGSPEACYFTGPLFDPQRLQQDERKTVGGSHNDYAVGSIHLKHGLMDSLQGKWDSFLPLLGPHSIVHRSIYVTYGGSVACATISSINKLSTAQVTFRYPVVGRVLLRQEEEVHWADTTVLVEYLVYADGSRNDTGDIHWRVSENPAGKDFYNWTSRCVEAGPVFNPSNCIDSETCAVGALSDRHQPLSASGGKERMVERTRRLFTDSNLPLSGPDSVLGRSLTFYQANGPTARGERLACSTITELPRVKAVVHDWYSNSGTEPSVKGRMEMYQETPYDLTNVEVTLKGLEKVRGYHVHVAPVEMQLTFPCEDSTLYGHWNPLDINPKSSPAPGHGTPEQYEMGDLSGKWGTLSGLTHASLTYNDSQLALLGPNSVIGRSVVIHKEEDNARWACATVERGYASTEARELRAIASFHNPGGFAYGYVRFTQLVYGPGAYGDTNIEIKLRHPGKNDRNLTRGHNWAVFVNPVGQDAAVRSQNVRCVAGGYVWNPYFIQLADPFNDELYREQCSPENPLRCYVGDLGRRLGPMNLGDKRKVFSDMNLPLEGPHSTVGRSLVIYDKDGSNEKYACANIEPDHDIIKYANIRRPPRFEVTKFLERVRTIMGIPEWMLTVDNRKTRSLHGNTCIQLLLHFRGPVATRLEQDFSRLLNLGSLREVSLFIPGVYPDPKKPTHLSYKQCGAVDTAKGKNPYLSRGSSLKIGLSIILSFVISYCNLVSTL